MKESTCIACGGSSIETAFTKGPFEIRRCRTCGLGRTADAEAFDAADYYSEAYFQGGHADSYGDYQGSEAILRAEFRRTIDYLLTQAPGRDRLLEFGCAYGFLLQEAAPHFARVEGIELSADAVRACQSKGLNVTAGVVDEATLHGPYQAVLGLDVIEHVPAPHETVRQLSTHMERGGVLLMTTGDWASAMARITGPHWRLMTPPQHLSFFTPRSMRAMLEAAGFRVTSLTHPVKHVPLSLIAYQLQRMAGMRPRNVAWLGGSFPVNLFDAMRVVAVKV